MHHRQAIREAVVTALMSKTNAGTRVFGSRMAPLARHELPAIIVYAENEDVAEASLNTAPRELERLLSLVVEVAVRATDNVDNELDDLAEQIEKVMHADPTFDGKASDSGLGGTEIELFEEQKQRIGALKLTYQVKYYTFAPALGEEKEDDVTPFENAHVEMNLEAAQEGEEEPGDGQGDTAKDDLDIPQT